MGYWDRKRRLDIEAETRLAEARSRLAQANLAAGAAVTQPAEDPYRLARVMSAQRMIDTWAASPEAERLAELEPRATLRQSMVPRPSGLNLIPLKPGQPQPLERAEREEYAKLARQRAGLPTLVEVIRGPQRSYEAFAGARGLGMHIPPTPEDWTKTREGAMATVPYGQTQAGLRETLRSGEKIAGIQAAGRGKADTAVDRAREIEANISIFDKLLTGVPEPASTYAKEWWPSAQAEAVRKIVANELTPQQAKDYLLQMTIAEKAMDTSIDKNKKLAEKIQGISAPEFSAYDIQTLVGKGEYSRNDKYAAGRRLETGYAAYLRRKERARRGEVPERPTAPQPAPLPDWLKLGPPAQAERTAVPYNEEYMEWLKYGE